jgi:hypothetical protein
VLDVVTEEATRRLNDGDLQYVLQLIQAEMIPATELKADRATELSAEFSTRLVGEDLTLAYAKVLDQKYGEAAVAWLQGLPTTGQQLRDLGLHSRIESPADAQRALTFLLKAYRLADVPFVLAIDEFERSVFAEDGTPNAAGRDLVKDVIEALAVNGHRSRHFFANRVRA